MRRSRGELFVARIPTDSKIFIALEQTPKPHGRRALKAIEAFYENLAWQIFTAAMEWHKICIPNGNYKIIREKFWFMDAYLGGNLFRVRWGGGRRGATVCRKVLVNNVACFSWRLDYRIPHLQDVPAACGVISLQGTPFEP